MYKQNVYMSLVSIWAGSLIDGETLSANKNLPAHNLMNQFVLWKLCYDMVNGTCGL